MTQINIQEQIEDFMKVVLLREKINCDRTWSFALERFFDFVKERYPAKYPDYSEAVINEYIDHMQQLNKSANNIVNSIKAILTYSEYARKEIDRSKITIIKEERNDHPYVEEDDDIFLMEKFLFQKVEQNFEQVDLNEEPTLEELIESSYGKFRDSLRNYLIFRMMIESAMDVHEIINLNMDHLTDQGLIELKNRSVPLSAGTENILRDYIHFRKNADEIVYREKVMREVFNGNIPFHSLEKTEQFFGKSKEEKTEEINSILQEQFVLAEKIQELEVEGDEEEEIEQLENQMDEMMEMMAEMKKILVYERKLDEFPHNDALFVLGTGERLTDSDCILLMEREAFPVSMLQNTIINKWDRQNIDANIVGRLIGHKNVSNKPLEDMTEQFTKVIEAGFQLRDRSIL